MKILHLSDTHGCHHQLQNLPKADVVVHSGDFCMAGTENEAIDFLNWFCDLPYQHKIFICGNHDDCLYSANIDGLDENVHYLCNSGIEIYGVKFYGVPLFMGDCITERQAQNYADIPNDVDVLITHCPPFGILDFDNGTNYGSKELLQRVSEVQPKLHLFGHIHNRYGLINSQHTVFSNASLVDNDACFCNGIHSCIQHTT